MFDLLIKNGTIIDGSGAPPFLADVAVKDGIFIEISEKINAEAIHQIDASSQIVAPGFVDIHRHADAAVFRPNFGRSELAQGITTMICGNCGLSIAPLSPHWKDEILQYLRPVIGTLPEGISFRYFSEYLAEVEKRSIPLNFGMLVGNGTLRMAAAGFQKPVLDEDDFANIRRNLHNAIEAGAYGVSLGLVYTPENNYDADTLVKALKPIAGTDIPLITHIRGEGDLLLDSLEEVINVASRLGVPLHVSHLKAVGQRNWGHFIEKALFMLDSARKTGKAPVTCDVYPWTAGSTQLIQLLPPEYLEGGMAQIVERLKNPTERQKCREILERPQNSNRFENQIDLVGWENILVMTKSSQGKGLRMTEIAKLRGINPYECAFDLIIEENGNVPMVNFIACEKDIEAIMRYPYSIIASDSIYPEKGLPHPRRFGTFPKVLGEYVRDKNILTLEQAVHKFTGAPAQTFGIENKGLIQKGKDADIVIFDLTSVGSVADYDNPEVAPSGINHVFVGGINAFESSSGGKLLRRVQPSI